MLEDLGKSIRAAFESLKTTENVDTALKDICNALLHANVPPKMILSLRADIQQKLSQTPRGVSKPKECQALVESALISLLNPQATGFFPKKEQKQTIMFVGLQGCGKTTTVCKYAAYYQNLGFKVGVICADTFRPGAYAQVKTHCLKLKIPYYGSDSADPVKTTVQGIAKLRESTNLLLIDTSGRASNDSELVLEMQSISKAANQNATILVVDAGIGQAAEAQALGFTKSIKIDSVILTKMDATKRAGGALATVSATKTPIAFIGSGEKLEDFNSFDPERFVSVLLGKGDLKTLSEKLTSLNLNEEEIAKKAMSGNLTLKDFYDQFVQLAKLGPLSSILKMLPGNFSSLNNAATDDKLSKMVCIFDSLSKNELNSDGKMFQNNASRVLRVAKGSGTSTGTVKALLTQFSEISNMMKKMAKVPGMSSLATKDPTKMTLAEKTRMRGQMKNMLPKDIFDQMSQLFQ